jgi:hypothetical protein
MAFRDYSMNFKSDRISDFIAEQLPAFVRMSGEDFVSFLEAYYRFLESKILEVIVSSEEAMYGDIDVGEAVSSVHCLMANARDTSNTLYDGAVTYIGNGDDNDPLMELTSYRKYEYSMTNSVAFEVGETVIEKYANNELTGASGEVKEWNSSTKILKITAPEGFFANNNILVGSDSLVSSPIIRTYHELIRPSKIVGTSLGSIDLDNETVAVDIPRKKLIVNHLAGSIERFLQSGEAGELFNKTLLDAISDSDASLPTIYNFTEVETPIYAMNNMFNFGDIDYAFNNSLFLGADYYSYMAKELMANWPQTLASPTEEVSKAIIGRNIKDFYRSKGTEDSIKFIFRVLFGEEATIFKPSEKIFSLNDGRWSTDWILVVEKDVEEDILLADNRLIYSSANTEHYAYVESITEDGDNAILTLSQLFGDFECGGSINGTLISGETFSCPIVTSAVQTTAYASTRGILNGGQQAPVPGGHLDWNEDGMEALALEVSDLDSSDRVQDSDYYQLFSYVIRSRVDEGEYDQLRETIKQLAHPAGFKLFLEKI